MLDSVFASIWEQSNTCAVCASDVERRPVLSCGVCGGGWCVLSAVARHRDGTMIAAGAVKFTSFVLIFRGSVKEQLFFFLCVGNCVNCLSVLSWVYLPNPLFF